ncbi:MAG TPA: biotin transporter BioY [Longimicrobiales bacterium]|nr:biotin transporter BioY [Longimicrobiales bacterium]
MGEAIVKARAWAAEAVALRGARQAIGVAVFAVLTALSAYVVVRLPGIPVPVTMQTLVVILAGALLGPRLGAASQVTYLAAGVMGIPVFHGGFAGFAHLLGPTGGYLLAFPAAAFVTGVVAGQALRAGREESGFARAWGVTRVALALAAGAATILAGGVAQLAIHLGDPVRAVQLGVVPFLLGDALKVVAGLLVALRLRSRTLGLV